MICEEQGCECGVLGWVKVGIGLEGLGYITVEVADFARDCPNEF